MYIINVKWHYDSAHFLKNYHGKCERLHGHRYVVEAGLAFERLGEGGMAYDFSEAKRALETSAENQAKYIFGELKGRLGAVAENLLYVKVWETPNQWAQYSERTLFI
jgi:6-pyruvoyltetrahydropterin/6-carboxytetrahydropterin synthase